MTNLEDKIKKGIKTKKPKPYWQFLGVDISRELLVLAGWIVSVFLLGAIIYIIVNYSPLPSISRPVHFLWLFFSLPWELMTIFTAIVIGVYLLSKKISTFYRRPYVLVVILVASVAGGYFATEFSGINEWLANETLANSLYERQGRFVPGTRGLVTIGIVTQIDEDNIQIKDARGKTWTVEMDKDCKIETELKSGVPVRVLGLREDSTIEAIDINKEVPQRGICRSNQFCLSPIPTFTH